MKKTPFHLDKEHLVHINFKPFLLLLFLFIGVWGYGQDILFQENFEAATGAQNLTNPAYLNWQGAQFTQQTNDNYFWILDNSRCSVISGQHSLAVSRNSPATNGTDSYNNSSKAQTLAYYTTPIDATNYTNATLDFNWYCSGEVSRDFGKVAYSLDGNTWTILPSEYAGQPTAQNVVDLDLSVLDGQQFYIGFAWENDNRLGSNPSFVVDDIVIKGITIAPPPSNDTCSGAISLTPSANNTCNATTGTTVGATQSLPGCTGDADDDVWYSFVATHTNHDILVTTPGSIVNGINDIVFQVYSSSGTCALTSLGCKDDTGGSNNETASLTGATIGNTYYIRVFSYDGNGNEGTFDICITTPTITSCIPSISEAYHPPTNYIREISFVGTLEDVTNTSTFSNSTPRGYQDFTGLATKARQAQGEGVNIYVDSPNLGFYKAWVDWNNDGVFSPDERFYNVSTAVFNTTFGFVIPPTTPPGDYKIRIRMNSNGGSIESNFGPCGNLDYYGETEDYLFTVEPYCDATITSVTDGETCGESTVDLTVTGSAGTTEYRWYTTENGGTPIATTTTGNWTTPEINTTTSYYVTAYNGSCESWVRTEITATFNPVPTVIFNPAAPMVCGEDEIIQLTAEGDTEKVYLIDENFEGGGLGVFTNINLVDNQNNITEWQNKTSTFVPNQETWYPAISSGFGPNKFVMATSDVGTSPTHNRIMSPSVNSTDFLNLTLELRMYFSRYRLNDVDPENEYVTIEASRDDGTNWDEIERIVRDVGIGTRFEKLEFDLSAYINEPSLRVRVRYFSTWADGVAIDDIKLYGEKPLNTAFVYDPTTIDAFTDAAATTPYASGTPITSIYIRPTLEQLENETFEIPVNTTLFNGCEATGTAIVTNNTKIFKSPQNDWYDDDNWSPAGVPTIDNCVIIPNNQTSIVDGTLLHAEAKNVTVKNGGFLQLEPEYTLTVQDWINVENTGVFNIKNSASLIQINDVTTKPNSGNAHVQRAPKDDFSPVGNLNYVYWSSPVKDFNVGNISPNTSANLIWKWIPTITGNGSGNHGDWQNATGAMLDGTGYIVRGLSGTPNVLPATNIPVSNNTALFTGVPNNGEIVVPINRGNYTAGDYSGIGNTATAQDDNWNLLGNPYPSSISANAFVNLNTHISGTLYLWPHTALPSAANDDPFYGDYGLNYDNIYIEHNPTGTIPPTVGDLNIASGQAFMVLMMDTAGLSESVLFNNSLRDKFQANNSFYRQAIDTPEKHRIWLDLSGSDNKAHTLLVGYIENATNEYDRLYDGYNFVNNPTNFYSLIDESTFSIQGRAWPFTVEDTVPLGFTTTTGDIYNIGINTLDGLFQDDTQNIFLEDTYTGIIHDLKEAPYSFTTEAGSFNDRFILRYTNEELSIEDYNLASGLEIYAPKNNSIEVKSNSTIQRVTIYDLLGRTLENHNNINSTNFSINNYNYAVGTYIVKVTLSNGAQKTEKVVLKR